MKSQEELSTSSEDFDLFAEFETTSTGVSVLPEPPSKSENLPVDLNESTKGVYRDAIKELYARVEALEKENRGLKRKVTGLGLMYQKLKDRKEDESFKPIEKLPPEPMLEAFKKDCPKCGGSGHISIMVPDPLHPDKGKSAWQRCECFFKYEEEHEKWSVEEQRVIAINGKKARQRLRNLSDVNRLTKAGANGATT